MSPPRPYRIAGAVKAHDPSTFAELARLAAAGRLDGIQVYLKGPLGPAEEATVEAHADLPVAFAVHAPHHEDGVNPVEPTAPGDLSPAEGRARLEAGMTAALEAGRPPRRPGRGLPRRQRRPERPRGGPRRDGDVP